MALGIFIIFVSAFGAGALALLLFYLARVAWKNEKKAGALVLAIFGAACAAFALYMAAFLPGAVYFIFHF